MNTLFLENGTSLPGKAFGANTEAEGEVVFTTGMTGYLETLTDPSYYGQIVVFTFPLIGNYGVFEETGNIDETFESQRIWVKGVILVEVSDCPSHEKSRKKFAEWLEAQGIPALSGIDTRALTQVLREKGTILGKIGTQAPSKFSDPLQGRFVPEVSPGKMELLKPENPCGKTIAFLDCGAKNGIFRNFLKRGIRVLRLPFNQNPFELEEKFDGIFISNGPGDPETCTETIEICPPKLCVGGLPIINYTAFASNIFLIAITCTTADRSFSDNFIRTNFKLSCISGIKRYSSAFTRRRVFSISKAKFSADFSISANFRRSSKTFPNF